MHTKIKFASHTLCPSSILWLTYHSSYVLIKSTFMQFLSLMISSFMSTFSMHVSDLSCLRRSLSASRTHFFLLSRIAWELPGGPVVRTLHFHQGVWVRSLVGELRSCKPHGMVKKKENVLYQNSLIPTTKHFSSVLYHSSPHLSSSKMS